MKISKNILWIKPYLDNIKHMIDMVNITHIRSEKCSTKRREGYFALCQSYTDSTYRIILKLQYQRWHYKKEKNKCYSELKLWSKIDILTNLAHELAHVIAGFQHTPQHKLYECKFLEVFMKKLLEEGYVSEEIEIKTSKKTGVKWVS